ncbi:MAG: serine/threonine-protein kinase [Polyangiaceae bacterium]|jgi:serine/threonine-protein kinase
MDRTPSLSQRVKPGQVFAEKYRITRILGAGAMGVVYAAQHELLHHEVAVKLMRGARAFDAGATARFLTEARNASRIQSDHVVRVLDLGLLDSGEPFLVMELLDGADLAAIAKERGPTLPLAQTVDWLLEAIDAIAHAHAMGIVHRDLKPSNLFLSRRPDGTTRIKVLDFGISKAMQPAATGITATDAVLGTPVYMPPEQLRDAKRVDPRSDIWALGAVAYELLTGKLPFFGDNVVALFAAATETRPVPLRELRREIPEGLEAAVLRCLRREPAERFANVGDLGAALAPHGTATAAATLERILRVACGSQSATPLIEGFHFSSTGGDAETLAQSSTGGADAGQVVAPPSSGALSASPSLDASAYEAMARRLLGRPARLRAALATGAMALLLVGSLAYGLVRFHSAPEHHVLPKPSVSAVAMQENEPRDPLRINIPLQQASMPTGELSTGRAVPIPHVGSPGEGAGPLAPLPVSRALGARGSGGERRSKTPEAGAPESVPPPLPAQQPASTPEQVTGQKELIVNCHPPYVIDPEGHRRYKPACP